MKNSESDFVANVSHELKSPITIIRGFAQMLQDHPNLSEKQRQDATKKIVQNSLRLEKIIHHLLLLADKNQPPVLHPTSLIKFLEHCKDIVLATHPDVSLTIQCKEPEIIAMIEPDLMELAIINLLENGIKYSPKPAQIEIYLSQAKISIRDHGIGIEKVHLPHIFDRFYTVNKAQSRKLGGVGLGLSLVKTIIERHNGKIFVTSDYGKGSTFTIQLVD